MKKKQIDFFVTKCLKKEEEWKRKQKQIKSETLKVEKLTIELEES
jgi:hypothetical protein